MIDSGTAWAILVTPLGIAAGVGWIRCARMLLIARDDAAYQQWCVGLAKKANADTIARLIDTEDRLRRIERQRSDATRRGNLTKAARAKALRDATTAEVARTTKRGDAAADLQEAA